MILLRGDERQAGAGILAGMIRPSSLDSACDSRAHTMRRALPKVATSGLVVAAMAFACAIALMPGVAHAETVAQLKAQLAAIRAESQPAGAAYENATTDLENTQYRIKKTDARIKAATKKLAAAEEKLGSRADAMYREGGEDGVLSFVLGSTSWDDMVTRLDYITYIAAADAALVTDVKITRANLKADRAVYAADAVVQAKEAASLKVTRDAMFAKLAAKQSEYDRLLAKIAAQMALENPSGGVYPPGPNGMVFPVRGVYYYRNTWGAPRSGGRHHQGTDVMAAHGTKLVAVASGVATVRSSGLGGKSIYIKGNNGWTYYYAHLQGYAIKSGRVTAGQLIGYVGSSGNASGGSPHLHIQMGPGGRWVNPYPYLRAME